MLKASAAVEKRWVKEHLNGGECPYNLYEYHLALECDEGLACYDSLDWLSRVEVYSMADAWEQCPRADWLMWAVRWMRPTWAEVELCAKFCLGLEEVLLAGVSRKDQAQVKKWATRGSRKLDQENFAVAMNEYESVKGRRSYWKDCCLEECYDYYATALDDLPKALREQCHKVGVDAFRELFEGNPWKY